MISRCISLLAACLAFGAPVWSGHTLTAQEQKILESWLNEHSAYRLATDADCDCPGDIRLMRTGSGGVWKPVPDYHPYIATGDFNGDGVEDFAAIVLDRSKQDHNFALIVFNGPFVLGLHSPAFIETGLALKNAGLFYGPPRPKPYRLLIGPFESDSGSILIPRGRNYRWDR